MHQPRSLEQHLTQERVYGRQRHRPTHWRWLHAPISMPSCTRCERGAKVFDPKNIAVRKSQLRTIQRSIHARAWELARLIRERLANAPPPIGAPDQYAGPKKLVAKQKALAVKNFVRDLSGWQSIRRYIEGLNQCLLGDLSFDEIRDAFHVPVNGLWAAGRNIQSRFTGNRSPANKFDEFRRIYEEEFDEALKKIEKLLNALAVPDPPVITIESEWKDNDKKGHWYMSAVVQPPEGCLGKSRSVEPLSRGKAELLLTLSVLGDERVVCADRRHYTGLITSIPELDEFVVELKTCGMGKNKHLYAAPELSCFLIHEIDRDNRHFQPMTDAIRPFQSDE